MPPNASALEFCRQQAEECVGLSYRLTDAKQQVAKFSMGISPQELVARTKSRGAPCGTIDEFAKQIRARVDSGIQRIYFQALVPENTGMLKLLGDTLRSGV